MIPGFSKRLGWERGWKSCMANLKTEDPKMQMQLKWTIKWKKVATPPFLHQPPSFLSPLSSKKFLYPPSDSIFGRSYPPPPLIRGGGFQLWRYYVHVISVFEWSLFYVSQNITHSTKAHPFSPNQLTTLGFCMQVPILMIMAYVIGIQGKKRPLNLVLISHKYSQRIFTLHSVKDVKTCFHCNQKVKKLKVVWKIMVLVKN